MQDRAFAHEKIEFIWNAEVAEMLGASGLTGATLRDTVTGETRDIELDGMFVAVGSDPRVHLVHNKLELTADGVVKVDGRSSRTSVPGVFAAGDVIDASYRQAVTAAASGTVAALDAEHYLADLADAEGAVSDADEALASA